MSAGQPVHISGPVADADVPRLVAAARAGDGEAFAALVRAYATRLHRFVTALGISAADADDVLQDAFLRAHQNLDRYDPTWAFSTWLFTITRRLALNQLAKRRTVPLPEQAAELCASAPPEPDEDAGRLWLQARAVLPERAYQVLWLHYGEDLDAGGVGRVMGITALHARVLLHRARARLAKALGPGRAPIQVPHGVQP